MQSDDEDAESEDNAEPRDNAESDDNVMPKVKDNWKPDQWHGFIDDEDDNEYSQRLYKNGELYEEKEFGKIVLKPWMIFLDKAHLKKKLKDYCVQDYCVQVAFHVGMP